MEAPSFQRVWGYGMCHQKHGGTAMRQGRGMWAVESCSGRISTVSSQAAVLNYFQEVELLE